MKRIWFLLFFLTTNSGFSSENEIDLRRASARIDALVDANLEKQGIQPNSSISDEIFLRRAWLNIGGRIPTIAEANSFQESTGENKREKLIGDLLNSEAYVSHFFNFWADILRINDGLNQGRPTAEDAYRLWLKEALRQNTPYDEMVRQMITTSKPWWEDGAVGYFIRDRGMPLDAMSNTVRVFLGTRLECAQCHDHPFDEWTQMDFYKMAAFTYGIDSRVDPEKRSNHIHFFKWYYATRSAEQRKAAGREDFPEIKTEAQLASYKKGPNYPKALRRLEMSEEEFLASANRGIEAWAGQVARYLKMRPVIDALYRPVLYTAAMEEKKDLKLPHDYQYSNAAPGDVVQPESIFGPTAKITGADGLGGVAAFADWMTSPENPRFAKVIANRLWKEAFGVGIFEPIDEFTEHTQISNPELLAFLESLMLDLDFNLKAFLQVVFNTNAWQRVADTNQLVAGMPYHFPGPALRRMSAEQIWDSVAGLSISEIDEVRPLLPQQLGRIENHRRILEALESRGPDDFIAMVEDLTGAFKKNDERQAVLREKIMAARNTGDNEQYVALRQAQRMSGRRLSYQIAETGWLRQGAASSIPEEKMDFPKLSMVAPVEISRKQGITQRAVPPIPEPPKELAPEAHGAWKSETTRAHRSYATLTASMARASELRAPAPRGHFLRDFGQSDRIEIENSNAGASIPQALNLLNGSMTEVLANRFSVLGSAVHEAESNEEKVRQIFQGMFARQPSEGEMKLGLEEFNQKGDRACESLIWALLNTRQFLFVY